MRVLLVGGLGAVGRPLLPLLTAAGHEVHATTRSDARAGEIAAFGATPEVVDLLEDGVATDLIERVQPQAVIDQLTSLPQDFDPRKLKKAYDANNRIKRVGSGALIAAAEAGGVRRYILQSIAFLYAPGRRVSSESDPVWIDAPAPFRAGVETVTANERRVVDNRSMEGVVLRYGFFYGPGTWYATGGSTYEAVRKRQYPLIGTAGGVYSMLHVSDAATATLAAVERGSGIYNVVDDDPAPLNELVPEFAGLIGAGRPFRIPAWLAGVVAGRYLTEAALSLAGASNARAKADLGWTPSIPSWRKGLADFRDSYAD